MAAPRPHRVLKTIAAVIALAAVWAGAWGLQRWAPFAEAAPEVTWPTTIQPLAEYVENATDLDFIRPVAVEWVTDPEEFAARTAGEAPTDEERADSAALDAGGRALGLWAGEVSSIAADEQVFSATSVAYWLVDENVLVVAAEPDAEELTPRVRAEIVFELTLAIDDQHFDVFRRSWEADTRQEALAMVGLYLGDAIWVYGEYYDNEFGAADREAFDDAAAATNAEYDERVASVPPAYSALVTTPQSIGPTLVAAIRADGGSDAVHRAMVDPPVALDQVALPASKYLHRDPLEPVSTPGAPAGAEVLRSGQGGPVLLFLMLTAGLAANDALTAADGWGNDAYTIYRLDEQVCIDLHVVADSRDDADLLDAGLTAWAATRPAEAQALVGRDGLDLFASACDPGPAVRQRTPTQDEIDQFERRAFLIRYEIDEIDDAQAAECVGQRIFAEHTVRELYLPEGEDQIATAEDECTAGG